MGYGSITKEEALRRQRLLEQGIKVCSHCKGEFPLSEFCKDSTKKDGLSSLCKKCLSEQNARYKEKHRQWAEEHREELRERDRSPEKKAKRKQYREAHKDEIRARRKYYDTTVNGRYSIYKQGAKQRNIEFNLTLEEFDNITKQPCSYCGEFNGECDGIKYSGIDRIDSSGGYTRLNVIPCCEMCNKMKLDYDMIDWLKHIKKISNYLLSTMEEWK
jgi:hypothetical protein